MATGASTADLAVILIDARKGVLTQTRRHAYICPPARHPHVVVAINKIDLVDFDQARFAEIVAEFGRFAEGLGFGSAVPIPLSARYGDNLTEPSPRTPWHAGPTLLEHLETVPVDEDRTAQPFRLPIQWVNRPEPRLPRPVRHGRGRPRARRATRWW
jgi:bifunctional enzyme CysN/CysC